MENVAVSLKMASFSRPTSSDRAPTSLQEYFVADCKSLRVMSVPMTEGLYRLMRGGVLL